MFGVSRSHGKSFTLRQDAEAFYEEHVASGLVDKVTRPCVGVVAASIKPLAVLTEEDINPTPAHYPQIPIENPWGTRMGAYVVIRGRAPGLYRSW